MSDPCRPIRGSAQTPSRCQWGPRISPQHTPAPLAMSGHSGDCCVRISRRRTRVQVSDRTPPGFQVKLERAVGSRCDRDAENPAVRSLNRVSGQSSDRWERALAARVRTSRVRQAGRNTSGREGGRTSCPTSQCDPRGTVSGRRFVRGVAVPMPGNRTASPRYARNLVAEFWRGVVAMSGNRVSPPRYARIMEIGRSGKPPDMPGVQV